MNALRRLRITRIQMHSAQREFLRQRKAIMQDNASVVLTVNVLQPCGEFLFRCSGLAQMETLHAFAEKTVHQVSFPVEECGARYDDGFHGR